MANNYVCLVCDAPVFWQTSFVSEPEPVFICDHSGKFEPLPADYIEHLVPAEEAECLINATFGGELSPDIQSLDEQVVPVLGGPDEDAIIRERLHEEGPLILSEQDWNLMMEHIENPPPLSEEVRQRWQRAKQRRKELIGEV